MVAIKKGHLDAINEVDRLGSQLESERHHHRTERQGWNEKYYRLEVENRVYRSALLTNMIELLIPSVISRALIGNPIAVVELSCYDDWLNVLGPATMRKAVALHSVKTGEKYFIVTIQAKGK